LTAILISAIIASAFEMNLSEGLRTLTETRWGITTLIDLYAGLFIVAVWIALLERSALRTAPWVIALVLLGNLATLLFILYRCFTSPTLAAAFLNPRSPAESRTS
ncbi:MAG: DUF1475 family protein, partial [Planctomycetota bacterium]|nr:DUF1475 family protein [Planctomycetota bacterium]